MWLLRGRCCEMDAEERSVVEGPVARAEALAHYPQLVDRGWVSFDNSLQAFFGGCEAGGIAVAVAGQNGS